jgi:phage baseplate assembly protein W
MMKRLYNQKVVSSYRASVPEQNQKFFYKGFSSTNKNKNFKLYDLDLVKRDLLNHFYIRKGEKLENPRFGTVIWAMLFEQFTDDVKAIIANDVETILNYDPRIAVNDVIIDSTEQGIRIQADITYLRFNVQEKMQFTFDRDNSLVN